VSVCEGKESSEAIRVTVEIPKGGGLRRDQHTTNYPERRITMSTRTVSRSVTLALGALFALVVLGTTQALAIGSSSSRTGGPDYEAIDAYVQEQMQEMRMPGAGLGIVKGDEIVHLESFGDADDSGRDVTSQTPFKIGSTSKSFTALAIMQLVEDGKVDLDAPVQRYIPWFRVADLEASKRITVRNLLNQTSGIPTAAGLTYMYKGDSSKDALEKEVRESSNVELTHPPGKVYQYSNLNYTTLGLIVQMVSGESYEQYAKEHILTPLGMNNSFVFLPEAQRHGLATGHQFWFGRPFPGGGLHYNRAITPAGLITSDARDMSRYLIAQLNGGRYEGTQVLSPEGIAGLHRGTADMGQPDVSYAMGWIDGEMDGVPIVWHNGDTGDFHATMILVPEREWGMVVLMNGSNGQGNLDTTANGVVARLLGVEPPPSPGPFQNPIMISFLVILAAGVLQISGIVRSVVLARRWRAKGARRPHGVVGVGLRVGLPLVLNLLWAVILLVVLPPVFSLPLQTLMFQDLGLTMLLSGGLALIWGVVLRPVLVLLALRTKGAPGDAGAPEKARVRVPA
jgi:CubicO group peptidase (beta-lactamase class C family)